jgi:hypothetical protein
MQISNVTFAIGVEHEWPIYEVLTRWPVIM